jgi:FkbM family methyltransferase
MSPPLRTIGKQLLPSGLLQRMQAARWRLRRWRHRARWLASGHRGAGIGIGTFDGHRIAYRLHSVDSEVLGHSFGHDIFFAAIPGYVLPDDGVVLDVGAHIGTFSVLAAERVPRGRVFAVEASRDTFNLLRVNVVLNRRTNVVAEHLALAGVDGDVSLYHDPEGNYGHSITKPLSPSTEVVRGQTLATFIQAHGITSIALAKFNCEGAEFGILLSAARETVRRIGKMIVLYHCDLVQEPVSVLIEHLAAAGFATEVRETSADRGWLIATRINP